MRRVPLLLVLLLSLGLALAACGRPRGGGGGGGDDDDDDDSARDDDDAGDDDAGDDDAGDDDAVGAYEGDDPGECADGADNDQDGLYDCDDPDCFGAPACDGDDDDAAGDDDVGDDDAAGDDDASGGGFVGSTYCLDWSTVTNLQPAILTSLPLPGVSLTDYPLLFSPTNEVLGAMSGLIVGAAAGTCTQDTTQSTGQGGGTRNGASFSMTFPAFGTSLLGAPGDVDIATITGSVGGGDEQLVDGTLDLYIGGTSVALLCSFATCAPCPTLAGDCLHVTGEDAVWDRVSSSPLTAVP